MTFKTNLIKFPAAASRPVSLTTAQVAEAYHFPAHTSGAGSTIAVIELGGAVNPHDLTALGLPQVVSVPVNGAKIVSDPSGADGEVMLDVEVILDAAPDVNVRVYFGGNADEGFYDAFADAVVDLHSGDAISCSWGGAENGWSSQIMDQFDALFERARAAGINIFCASGDTGSSDSGGRGNHVDFPASSPNVVACGGTALTLDATGQRADEVTWNDDPQTSATGGGDSAKFLGRAVPDVAGNADPRTGYEILVNGQSLIVGGTSAVAPLMAALSARLTEAAGSFDFQKTITASPEVCFDVTAGDNGAFRAGPGRDKVTGFGVPDGVKMLAVLQPVAVDPPSPPPVVTQPPVTTLPPVLPSLPPADVTEWAKRVARQWWHSRQNHKAAAEYLDWLENTSE